MTTIIFTFFLAFFATFFFTPLVGKLARRFGIVDNPSGRKVHSLPIPRIGGVALFVGFFVPIFFLVFNETMFADLVSHHDRLPVFVTGAILIFILGLWDDIRPLPPGIKFLGQILVSVIVYLGGIKIHTLSLPFIDALHLGYLSLPVTVFWFVLVINAINLIDGLDGLAAGISLFVSITMLVICLTGGRIMPALAFAALGGSLIGFLRYNFNPASIFMGDSGSYFLGYTLAGLSILSSIKGQMATALLIPIIAMGIPLIDTMWAPIRRFVLGQKMFQPDSGHLHHRLMALGYSHRRAVFIIYSCTIILGFLAILMVHTKDETAALVLLVLGSGIIILTQLSDMKVLFRPKQIASWVGEMSDSAGISYERRSFLNHQLSIVNCRNSDELWQAICRALKSLEIDMAELVLYNDTCLLSKKGAAPDEIEASADCEPLARYKWQRFDNNADNWLLEKGVFKLEMPLLDPEGDRHHYGTLILVKDIFNQPAGYYMLTRIEHLRRSINTALLKIREQRTATGAKPDIRPGDAGRKGDKASGKFSRHPPLDSRTPIMKSGTD